MRAKVVRVVKREYPDFGPTLAAEYLGEKHGVVVSKESVRQILAQAGATVVGVARSRELLEKVKAPIEEQGGKAHAFVADVRKEADVIRMAEQVCAEAGAPDILINNAGINLRKLLHEFTLEEWRRVMQTNLDSAFLSSRAFVPGMIGKKFGRIINRASTMAHISL